MHVSWADSFGNRNKLAEQILNALSTVNGMLVIRQFNLNGNTLIFSL
jgi:hypothetical protein